MAIIHRMSGLLTAILASAAFTFCILAVMVCDFVEINAKPGSLIESATGEELMEVTANFGILCEDVFYDGSDKMWELSRTFFYVSVSLGAVAVILAWAVSTVLPPTTFTWRLFSSLAAVTSVLQVPIFLIFESEPCTGSTEVQTCSMSLGSYYLIGSTILWVVVTLCTQCLDPPSWADHLSLWRIPEKGEHHLVGTDEEFGNFPPQAPKSRFELEEAQKYQAERESKKSDLSLPAVSTDSMKDDEFDWYSPRGYDDSPSMVDQGKEVVLRENQKSMAPVTQERWLDERAKKSTPPSPARTNDEVSYFQASVQSQATEHIRVVASPKRAPQSPRSARSPGSGSQGSVRSRTSRTGSGVATSLEILADLNTEAKEHSAKVPLTSADRDAPDRYSLGLRALTGKLTKDARRRRTRRRQRRTGYDEMLADDDDDSDDQHFMSPPIEVKIQPFADFEHADFSTDDEKEELMDNWNALHKATTAGVRMGVQEGHKEGDWIDFDSPIKGYYSDPEPAYYPSDASKSQLSLTEFNGSSSAGSRTHEDSSTISGLSGSAGGTPESKKARNRKTKRRRLPSSANASVVSGGASLLDVTIDEETDQDVMKEISDDDEAEGILGAYSLQRTFSAPSLRNKGSKLTGQRRRQELETISLNPSRMSGRMRVPPKSLSSANASAFRAPIDPTAKTSELLSLPKLDKDRSNLEVIDIPMPPKKMGSSPKDVTIGPTVNRQVQSRSLSLSPRRNRSLKLETWKTDAMSLGGINARRARLVEDDSSSQSSEGSTQSKVSQRARKARIKRIKRMKEAKKQLTQYDSDENDRRQASAHTRIRNVDADARIKRLKRMKEEKKQLTQYDSDENDRRLASAQAGIQNVDTDARIKRIKRMKEAKKQLTQYDSYEHDRRLASAHARIQKVDSDSIHGSDHSVQTEIIHGSEPRAIVDGSESRNRSYRDRRIIVVSDADRSTESANESVASSQSYESKSSKKAYRDHRIAAVSDTDRSTESANEPDALNRSYDSESSKKSYRDHRIAVVSDTDTSTESANNSEPANRSYRSEPSKKSYRDHRTTTLALSDVASESEATSRSYPDRRTILSDLLRDAQSKPDPDGETPEGMSSPDDFADLYLDDTLPKFSVNLESDINHSPTVSPRHSNDSSPELSPIPQDKNDQPAEVPADDSSTIGEGAKEFPTMTTENDTMDDTVKNEEQDEFPVDTDIALMTGIADLYSNDEEFVIDDNFESKYGSFDMDDLNLQLIEVRRPIGQEYGDDEESV
jgi:hypothetical protein